MPEFIPQDNQSSQPIPEVDENNVPVSNDTQDETDVKETRTDDVSAQANQPPQQTSDWNDTPATPNATHYEPHNAMQATAGNPGVPSRASKVKVAILDQETPILVLVGPPACGKTTMLYRLTMYLLKCGYGVLPDYDFRAEQDARYKALCDEFMNEVSNTENGQLPASTDSLDFMLLTVTHEGKKVLQILEAPGEHYFNPDDPKEPKSVFLSYINDIANSKNKKIWAIMTEPHWKGPGLRSKYATKIKQLQKIMKPSDASIVVYNKIDTTQCIGKNGVVNMKSAMKEVDDYYPGLFEAFRNRTPILRLFQPYTCMFVPFQTGSYFEDVDGATVSASDDKYPHNLLSLLGLKG